MNIKQVKEILGRLEHFSVDTQPIRDLIHRLHGNKTNISKYLSLLDTLQLVLDTSFLKAGDSSSQLDSIMSLISSKLDEIEDETPNIPRGSQEKKDLGRDIVIMSALLEIKKDLDTLKLKDTTIINNINSSEYVKTQDSDLKPVYIEHNIDTSNIKTNFNIDSKTESNVSSKLERLKKLIKGGK